MPDLFNSNNSCFLCAWRRGRPDLEAQTSIWHDLGEVELFVIFGVPNSSIIGLALGLNILLQHPTWKSVDEKEFIYYTYFIDYIHKFM